MFYIFLDCDGVINTKSSWIKPYSIDKEKIRLIAELAKKLNAKIVLSSTWKNGFDKEENKCSPQIILLKKIFKEFGVDINLVTPNLVGRTRDKEIERFLYFNPSDKYIILDDDSSLFINKKNLYIVDYDNGITLLDIKNILKKYK